ncbi:MAG TPA: hypothetical protein DEA49_05080 [Petrotoga sp.]|nr:MAG: FAD-dependent pyridine nucleotide-disulfide oxidoreductase [Petrotoga mobilis]HBT51467.1 hypothetical protein [Petrotoga sp.]
MRYVIVGASAAGLNAARTLESLDPQGEITILSAEEVFPYSKMSLPYLLSNKLKKRDYLFLPSPSKANLMLGQRVVNLDVERKKVETGQNKTFSYDKLLITTGAEPYVPDMELEGSPLVLTVRNLSDMDKLKDKLNKSDVKRVILSGAGLVNSEIADALAELNIPGTFVIRSHRMLSQIVDEEGSEIIAERARENGMELITGESIKKVQEEGDHVNVFLTSGKVIQGSCVVVGKGVRPSIDFLERTPIKCDTGILVNEYMETSVNDVYAAGDVTESIDLISDEYEMHALWPVAMEQSRIAATNMVGYSWKYSKEVSRNIVNLFGEVVFTGGISKEDAYEVYKEKEGRSYHKILVRDGKLVGFIFVGSVLNPGVYLAAMKNQWDISNLLNEAIKGALSYSMFKAPMREVVNI